MTMSDKIKETLNAPEVPDELRPENIPSLIENRGKKRKNITRIITGTVSAAAVCTLVIAGSAAVNSGKNNADNTFNFAAPAEDMKSEESAECNESETAASDSESFLTAGEVAFVPIESYDVICEQMKKNHRKNIYLNGEVNKDYAVPDTIVGEEDTSAAVPEAEGGYDNINSPVFTEQGDTDSSDTPDVYDTLSQVEGIAEADIIKANSECVYYVVNGNLRYIPFDSKSGKFGECEYADIVSMSGMSSDDGINIVDMYLSGDRLSVICSVYAKSTMDAAVTGVYTFDTSDAAPVFLQSSFQTGWYSSSRMKDGILYLITNQDTWYGSVVNENEYSEYIPCSGNSVDDLECLPCENIYQPRDWDSTSDYISYINISAIDTSDTSQPVSAISVAGFSGDIYCSYDNIYTAGISYADGSEDTVVTRFTLENNEISPVASGRVSGYVHDQFSMDEYNGYFRIATTSYPSVHVYEDDEESYAVDDGSYEPVNNVYVLDMGMNIVGSITGFAETETVKSVSFNGDTGYVVTYEQTDPLFAIDLSDPQAPVITDEFKITGYSSFLRKWDDDHLFGFGIDATEDAYEVGVKLVMFNVSDGDDLKECGYYAISGENAHGVESPAVYDRKALLFSPQKNIIGFPVYDYSGYYKKKEYDDIYFSDIENYDPYDSYPTHPEYTYRIISYEDGEFKEKKIVNARGNANAGFERGLYIGDYICIFSANEAVSVNISTLEETDRIDLM